MTQRSDAAPRRIGCALLSLIVVVAAAAGCTRDGAPAAGGSAADGRPTVVASIFPVYDLARFMGEGFVNVEVLLPPRASPSTFEPTARQMARLSGADGYIFIGGGLDHWAERLVQPGDFVVRLTDGLELEQGHAHEGDPGTGNPHVWLDPILVRDALLPRIEDVLARAAPERAAEIGERARALSDSLTSLDLEIREALSGLSSRAFVSTHSAWVYFAQRYGLLEVGAVYESPGREPSSRHLARLVEDARAAGVRAVFVEPQLGEAGARAVAAELGAEVYLLDPQGGQEGREGYLSLMRYDTRQFAAGLGAP
jgi:ABC-type Zn uptake system ZnuABC Zn-binding protein ZnuA